MSDPSESKESKDSKEDNKKREKKKGAAKFVTSADDIPASSILPGQLKDFSLPMADAYQPSQVESGWNDYWREQGLYRPASDFDKDFKIDKDNTFVIVIPPPNVTGTLHLGHALTCAIEDAIVRYHRMNGKNVLWVPGTDHAGIATQVVVEKKLMKENKQTRHDLGRENFMKEVWKWKETNGNRISSQIARLGASVDWSREAFTMDENLSRAVQRAFITLHSDKKIYRANRLVQWSCALRTAISNIEVESIEINEPKKLKVPLYDKEVEFGVIHSFAYKLADGSGEIIVATTRIETMLGDVAVAVHPNDTRYTSMHGKALVHPFIPDREMKVVTDSVLVDMNFGTGAVKITPAHDPNDFLCGQRNNLPFINIFTDGGIINENGGPFEGQKRFDTRENIIKKLTELGLYKGKAPNKMVLGICSRSKDIVEPVLRPQWWVNCTDMARRAVKAVEEGELKIIPAQYKTIWNNWLVNIQDWCISRQLWWGHRIPAYHVTVPSLTSFATQYKDENEYWVVAPTKEAAFDKATHKFSSIDPSHLVLTQDEDVLDTWFSSGLFPFSTLGWPNETNDYKNFYPGTLLETGHDILFFWVARMVMMGLELTNQLPFTSVYLHPMVRDKFGRKMSKTLGNVIDPLDVIYGISLQSLQDKLHLGNLDINEIEKAKSGQLADFPDGIPACGADALRFQLLAYLGGAEDINMDIQQVIARRQFCNKIWQATKFALMNFDKEYEKPKDIEECINLINIDSKTNANNNFADRWILSRLAYAIERANNGFSKYEFSEITSACYDFFLYELCDVYLELIKPIVKNNTINNTNNDNNNIINNYNSNPNSKKAALATLYICLEHALRLMHPIMPYITEELYHRLPQYNINYYNNKRNKSINSIMLIPYPATANYSSSADSTVESHMKLFQDIAKAARSTRSNLGLTKKKIDLYLIVNNEKEYDIINSNKLNIAILSIANNVVVELESSKKTLPEGCISTVITPNLQAFVPLRGLVDFSAELFKMEKSVIKLKELIENSNKKMNAPGYEKTKEEIKIKEEEKLKNDKQELSKLEESVNNFKSYMNSEELIKYEIDRKKIRKEEAEKIKLQMDKLLPGGDKSKAAKKILAKYEDLEKEFNSLVLE